MYERLTKTYADGSHGVADNLPCGENSYTFKKLLIDRLAEYEDSGLSPDEVQELAKAKAEGRLVMLPPPEESDYEGLKVKYRVYKAKDNTPVENCFVLRPEKDLAAVAALTAYAHATDNKQLAEDILNWITPDERVKVLPCKTEDTVFIVYAKKILETTVDKRAWTDDDGYMLRTKEEWFKEKDIGKTVFLSREEAEKAIGGESIDKS